MTQTPAAQVAGHASAPGEAAEAAADPDDPAAQVGSAPVDERPEPRDWEWVEEWRASGEPAPWSLGVTMAVFTAVVVGSAVYVVTAGLSDRPLIAVIVDLAVAGGVAPAIWLSRKLPVLRWLALGGVLGIAAAWIGALLFLV